MSTPVVELGETVNRPLNPVTPADESYKIRLIAGNANPKLAADIAKYLKIAIEETDVGAFADGEIKIAIKNNIRGADCFIIQPSCPPNINTNFMELLLLTHTLKLSSAKRVTVVCPYYGYARQDRKTQPRTPISAAATAQLIEAMGPDRVLTVDLHADQLVGFFQTLPVDNLFAEKLFVKYLRKKNFDKSKLIIVSPDAGGVTRARRVADALSAASVVTILKRRVAANQVDSMQLVGDVSGADCVIVDDIIDTAGTLTKAAKLLADQGAASVVACASHGVFSKPAMQRLNDSVLTEVCVTDTIPQEHNVAECSKLKVLSMAPLLGEAIARIHLEQSLSVLFKETQG